MSKTGKYLEFIALVVLTGLVLSGCLSGPESLTDTMPTGADGSSLSAQSGGGSSSARAGGSSASVRAGGDSSSAQGGLIHRLGAEGQKKWSKFVERLGKCWLFWLIILIICIVCVIICRTVKRRVRKPLKRNIIIASVILASLGLIYGVVYFGMMWNDGKLKNSKWEQVFKRVDFKRIPFKNKEAKTEHAYINTNRLNVRSGPSLSGKIIRGLPRNTRLEVIDDSGTWWKVKYENTEGYVNSKYLRKE